MTVHGVNVKDKSEELLGKTSTFDYKSLQVIERVSVCQSYSVSSLNHRLNCGSTTGKVSSFTGGHSSIIWKLSSLALDPKEENKLIYCFP